MPIDLLNSIKGIAEQVISSNAGVPADKKNLAIETVTGTVATGLKDLGGSALTSLLSGGGGGNMLQGIEQSVLGALTNKVGLDQGVAGNIISSLLPQIVNLLTHKSGQGVDIGSLLGGLGNLGNGGGGGLLGIVKGLFGGK